MRHFDKDTLLRYLLIAATALLVLLCFWLFFGHVLAQVVEVIRYIGILVSPFLIAWLIAVISRPFNAWLVRRLHFRPSGAVLITILLLLLLILGIVLLLVVVIAGLMNSIIDNAPMIKELLAQINEYLDSTFVNIDLGVLRFDQYVENFQTKLGDWATQGIGVIFNIAKGTPAAVIWFIVTLVAVFYWCRDEESVVYHLCRLLPQKRRAGLRRAYDNSSRILGGYIRSQFLLVLIAAVICTVGMALCGVKSPLVMGVFAGILDMIPIVGPGVVLIGWMIWALIISDYGMAIGLAVVYVVVIVSRQILNPKLVGDGVGLHPLLALAAIFIGMKMFGLVGVVIGPVVVAIGMMLLGSRSNATVAAPQNNKN